MNRSSGAPNLVSSLCLVTHARSPALPVASIPTTENKFLPNYLHYNKKILYFNFHYYCPKYRQQIFNVLKLTKLLISNTKCEVLFPLIGFLICWMQSGSHVGEEETPPFITLTICTPSPYLPLYVPYLRSNPFSLVSSKTFVLYENSSYEDSPTATLNPVSHSLPLPAAIHQHEWRIAEDARVRL